MLSVARRCLATAAQPPKILHSSIRLPLAVQPCLSHARHCLLRSSFSARAPFSSSSSRPTSPDLDATRVAATMEETASAAVDVDAAVDAALDNSAAAAPKPAATATSTPVAAVVSRASTDPADAKIDAAIEDTAQATADVDAAVDAALNSQQQTTSSPRNPPPPSDPSLLLSANQRRFFRATDWLLGGLLGLMVAKLAMFLLESPDVLDVVVDAAEQDELILAQVGSPLKGSLLWTGNVSDQQASVVLPVSGPKGKATIHARAFYDNHFKMWKLMLLQASFDATEGAQKHTLTIPERYTVRPRYVSPEEAERIRLKHVAMMKKLEETHARKAETQTEEGNVTTAQK